MRNVRIYVLLARENSRAVVFRRGPSKQVLVLAWDTATDVVEAGQWLKGRIYERRCDLAPEGDFLLYFAATYRPPYFSWSAVSRPPYLTALALWPKGDGWGGGGHFKDRDLIALNHRETEMSLADGFQTRPWLTIEPFGSASGWGEDISVWWQRLEREGWTLVSGGEEVKSDLRAKVWIQYDPPIIWERRHPIASSRYMLQMSVRGIREKAGPWYVTEHRVVSEDQSRHELGRSDWADWSRTGDLLFSRESSLWRLPFANGELSPVSDAREVANLAEYSFERRDAPSSEREWPRK